MTEQEEKDLLMRVHNLELISVALAGFIRDTISPEHMLKTMPEQRIALNGLMTAFCESNESAGGFKDSEFQRNLIIK